VVAPYPEPQDPLTRLKRLLEARGVPGLATAVSGMTESDLRALARLLGVVRPLLSLIDDPAGSPPTGMSLLYDEAWRFNPR
jgi:hypothetical protein